jgi:predicted metal-dependent HD superfamily phosphohydrolase
MRLDDRLRERWERVAVLAGASHDDATRVLRDLWRRYDEPHRAYHTLAHLRHLFAVLDLLRTEERCDDPVALELAAWFHDAVYDPRARDNEVESAELACDTLRGWQVPDDRVAVVRGLVLATADHRAATPDQALLCDADLAVLAGDGDSYSLYVRAVRVEYGHLDLAAWRRGRAAVVERLLARDPLYATAAMRRRAEAAARRNLADELARLRRDLS